MSRTLLAAACAAVAALSPGPVVASDRALAAPRIDAVTPLVQLSGGPEVCVCGHFPTPEAAAALRVDGRPATVIGSAGKHRVDLHLPPGLSPGSHTITGTPEAGYAPGDRHEIRIVAVNDEVSRPWPFSRKRRIRLLVAGTKEPVKLWLRNDSPGSITLAGGPRLELVTSGGRRNRVVVTARVTRRSGLWTLTAGLDAPACPCDSGDGDHGGEDLSRELARSVTQAEAWFRGRRPALLSAEGNGTLPGAVLDVLDGLERRLLRAVETPELAALRAWVEDRLAEERARWRRGPGAGVVGSQLRRPDLAFAQHPPAVVAQAPRAEGSAGSFIERVLELFRELQDVSGNLYADLCVRFDPREEEVLLWVYPKRYPAGRRTASPDAVVPRLARGLYCVLLTDPVLEDDEFALLAAAGACRNPLEARSAPGKRAEGRVRARGEADLVRELDRFLACRKASKTCTKEPIAVRFLCERGGR